MMRNSREETILMGADNRTGVVVGVDGSPASDAAVDWAAGDAAMHGDSLTILTALDRDDLSVHNVETVRQLRALRRRNGAEILEHARDIAQVAIGNCRKPTIEEKMVFASPAKALTSESDGVRMLVVGRAGRSSHLGRVTLGSVSNSLIHHARCTVAVIPRQLPARLTHAPVLLGIDGTESSESAVAIAFDAASRRRAPLTVVHALTRFSLGYTELTVQGREVLSERLSGWRERYPDVVVTAVVVPDPITRWLIEHSDGTQLVVVGSRNAGTLAHIRHRSVSAAVTQGVGVPAIVAAEHP